MRSQGRQTEDLYSTRLLVEILEEVQSEGTDGETEKGELCY